MRAILLLLLQALRVSVGKLGIIARLRMRIVRELPVRRSLAALTPAAFLDLMRQAAAADPGHAYPSWMTESQIFWIVQKHQVRLHVYRVFGGGGDDP